MQKPSPGFFKNMIQETFLEHQVSWLGCKPDEHGHKGYAVHVDKLARLMQIGHYLGEESIMEPFLEDFMDVELLEDGDLIVTWDADLFFDLDMEADLERLGQC